MKAKYPPEDGVQLPGKHRIARKSTLSRNDDLLQVDDNSKNSYRGLFLNDPSPPFQYQKENCQAINLDFCFSKSYYLESNPITWKGDQ